MLLLRLQDTEALATAPAAAQSAFEPELDDVMQDIGFGASQTGDAAALSLMPTPPRSPKLGRALFSSPISACAGASFALTLAIQVFSVWKEDILCNVTGVLSGCLGCCTIVVSILSCCVLQATTCQSGKAARRTPCARRRQLRCPPAACRRPSAAPCYTPRR